MEILLLLLILNLLFFQKKPTNILYCGLFGWVGDSNKKFNWDKFNLLGLYNDSRGGDSCGRASGEYTEYGIKTTSDYSDFIIANRNFPIKERIVLGHDRKASWGYAITEDNAQPINLKEDGEIAFTLIHNGTIHNKEELETKYHEYGATDSIVLSKIIYKYGFDVLSEYYGSAALVIYDRRKYLDTGDSYVYLFKGASKNYSTSVEITEERPLYIYEKTKGSYYISSLEESLWAIGAEIDETHSVDSNKVFTIKNGILQSDVIEINRHKTGQYKFIPSTYPNRYAYEDEYGYGNDYGMYQNDRPIGYNRNKVYKEVFNTGNKPNKVYYEEGLFKANKEVLNGIIHLTLKGEIKGSFNKDTKPFYFKQGVMIPNHTKFRECNIFLKNRPWVREGTEVYKKEILPFSRYPLQIEAGSSAGAQFYSKKEGSERRLYSGVFQPVFSEKRYSIKSGLVMACESITEKEVLYPTDKFEEDNYDNDLEVMEQEASKIMAEILESIQDAKSNLESLGKGPTINILVKNLDTIEDEIFITEKGSLLKEHLKLKTEWKNPF